MDVAEIFHGLSYRVCSDPASPKKMYLILKLNYRPVKVSMTRMFVLPDSRDMYNSFVTQSVCSYALITNDDRLFYKFDFSQSLNSLDFKCFKPHQIL